MDITIEFMIYATLFRLGVITAGVVSIVLGYRLFMRGIVGSGDSGIGAAAGGLKLEITNAAPGTFFALFGAAIIGVMVYSGSPELIQQQGKDGKSMYLKGQDNDAEDSSTQAPASADPIDYSAVLENTEVAPENVAVIFNDLAWVYQQAGRLDDALSLARLAVRVDADNGSFLDTLARTLYFKGLHQEALAYAQLAVAKDANNPYHLHTLALILEARGDRADAITHMEKATSLAVGAPYRELRVEILGDLQRLRDQPP